MGTTGEKPLSDRAITEEDIDKREKPQKNISGQASRSTNESKGWPFQNREQMGTTSKKPLSDKDTLGKDIERKGKHQKMIPEQAQRFTNEAKGNESKNTKQMRTTGEKSGSQSNKFKPQYEKKETRPEMIPDRTRVYTNEGSRTRPTDIEPMDTTEQKPRTYGQYHVGNEYYHAEAAEQNQVLASKMLQRSMEASKQMLFDVFCNFITILEEFERRELERSGWPRKMPISNIPSPSQTHKSFNTVESIVKAQLFMMENQTIACPPEVLPEVKEDLRLRIIKWAAVRADNNIMYIYQTDYFIAKLYEILVKGSTEHHFPERFDVSQESIREGFSKLLAGAHATDTLDEQFKANRDRNAVRPQTRCGESFRNGCRRISEVCKNQTIDSCLEYDLWRIQEEEPLSLR